jgi:hypothetical protein
MNRLRCLVVLDNILTISPAKAPTMSSAKQDVEELLNDFIVFAKELLEKHGEFFPFGATMAPDGESSVVAGYEGTEQPPSQEIINLLNEAFKSAAKSGEYKATALFFDVRVTPPNAGEKSDAVAVALDHRDNYSVIVFYPYTIANGRVTFGELFAQDGANRIFGASV